MPVINVCIKIKINHKISATVFGMINENKTTKLKTNYFSLNDANEFLFQMTRLWIIIID